jgi:hypothetical protein
MGKFRYSSTILDLSGQLDTLASLPRKLSHWIGGEPIWLLWSREKSSALAKNRTSDVQPVAISTELFGDTAPLCIIC